MIVSYGILIRQFFRRRSAESLPTLRGGLRHELAGTRIRVVTAYPGATTTQTAKHLPPERIPAWHGSSPHVTAGETARQLLAAIAGGHPTPSLSRQIGMLFALQRWLPRMAERLIVRISG